MILLSNAYLRAAAVRLCGHEPAADKLHLFGVRSASPVGPTTLEVHAPLFDKFDDALGTFGTELRVWPATVDPGRTWTLQPMQPAGAAHLEPGRWLFKPGLHRGKPALVQAAPVTVRRDRDRDGTAEPGEPVQTGMFGIQIHRMGDRPTVSDWSAGCQGLHLRDWSAFWALIEASGQTLFEYWLFEAGALAG